MSSEQPLKPGQVRITRQSSPPIVPLRQHRGAYNSRDEAYSSFTDAIKVGLLVIFVVVFVAVNFIWKQPPPEHRETSALSTIGRITLPPKPALEGRYAAFIRRGPDKSADAIVFTYEDIRINIVSFVPDEVVDAIAYPSHVSDSQPVGRSSQNSVTDRYVRLEDHMPRIKLGPVAPPPYVLHGDVTVEIGPLFNRDELITRLITRHGDLKRANITVVDGAPRGPPRKSDFVNRPARTVYVVGRVLKFSGPLQKDKSYVAASIIELGPDSQQLDQYIAESSAWRAKVATLEGDYPVANDLLWSADAEKGLEIAKDPRTRGYSQPTGHAMDLPGTTDRYHAVDHPVVVDHPVL
jgi:hypothetical protein